MLLEIIPIVFSIILLHLTIANSKLTILEMIFYILGYYFFSAVIIESFYHIFKRENVKFSIALTTYSISTIILIFTTALKYESDVIIAVWIVSGIVSVICAAVCMKLKK